MWYFIIYLRFKNDKMWILNEDLKGTHIFILISTDCKKWSQIFVNHLLVLSGILACKIEWLELSCATTVT